MFSFLSWLVFTFISYLFIEQWEYSYRSQRCQFEIPHNIALKQLKIQGIWFAYKHFILIYCL